MNGSLRYIHFLWVLAAMVVAAPGRTAGTAGTAEAEAAPPPAVRVDAEAKTVSVPATVCAGAKKAAPPTEPPPDVQYILVAPGVEESGSLLATPCPARAIAEALEAIGLQAGEAKNAPPEDRVRLFVEYEAEGKPVRRPIEEWLVHGRTGRPPEPIAWQYAGRREATDAETGEKVLAAAATGRIVSLDAADAAALVRPAAQAPLVRAGAKEVPEAGTAVRLIFEKPPEEEKQAARRVHVFVSGRVQGVGFRNFTQLSARRLGLVGWVRNLADKRVEAVVEGPPDKVAALLDLVRRGPPSAQVTGLEVADEEPTGEFRAFEVLR